MAAVVVFDSSGLNVSVANRGRVGGGAGSGSVIESNAAAAVAADGTAGAEEEAGAGAEAGAVAGAEGSEGVHTGAVGDKAGDSGGGGGTWDCAGRDGGGSPPGPTAASPVLHRRGLAAAPSFAPLPSAASVLRCRSSRSSKKRFVWWNGLVWSNNTGLPEPLTNRLPLLPPPALRRISSSSSSTSHAPRRRCALSSHDGFTSKLLLNRRSLLPALLLSPTPRADAGDAFFDVPREPPPPPPPPPLWRRTGFDAMVVGDGFGDLARAALAMAAGDLARVGVGALSGDLFLRGGLALAGGGFLAGLRPVAALNKRGLPLPPCEGGRVDGAFAGLPPV